MYGMVKDDRRLPFLQAAFCSPVLELGQPIIGVSKSLRTSKSQGSPVNQSSDVLHPKQNEDRMSSPNQCYWALQVQDDQNDFIWVTISPKIQFSMVNCSDEQNTAIPQEEVLQLVAIVL